MNFEQIAALWSRYKTTQIEMTMHPQERSTIHSEESYRAVGRNAAQAICEALVVSPVERVSTILDFGCGYGRNARHIRAMFPDATIYFADLEGADFCAETFRGIETPTSTDLGALDLPKGMDLIWLGSVFTHFDREKCQILFDKLFDALAENGLLVFSQHGRKIMQMSVDGRFYMRPEYWAKVKDSYVRDGFGYHDIDGFNGWGMTVARPDESISLGIDRPNARLCLFSENRWAGHDIVAWAKIPQDKAAVFALPKRL